jgi:hypothetical protein
MTCTPNWPCYGIGARCGLFNLSQPFLTTAFRSARLKFRISWLWPCWRLEHDDHQNSFVFVYKAVLWYHVNFSWLVLGLHSQMSTIARSTRPTCSPLLRGWLQWDSEKAPWLLFLLFLCVFLDRCWSHLQQVEPRWALLNHSLSNRHWTLRW